MDESEHRQLHPDRAVGALLGLAVGDALGATLEFTARDSRPEVRDLIGGGPFQLEPGVWTDDTSMALCLADSLIAQRGLDERDLLGRFVGWWRHGENSVTGRCFDIGNTTRASLARFERTGALEAGPEDPGQAGNGTLMRLAPAAIFAGGDAQGAAALADRQSRTTSPAPTAHDGCRLFAILLTEAMLGGDGGAVLAPRNWNGEPEIAAIAAGGWRGKRRDQISSSGYVAHTLEAALWCVDRSWSFEEAVILAANLADDSDTVAAVTGQLAGALWGAKAIPERWLEVLAWREHINVRADMLHAMGAFPGFIPDKAGYVEPIPDESGGKAPGTRERVGKRAIIGRSTMPEFGRGLREKGEAALIEMAAASEPNWFKDLLTLWVPSGSPSAQFGLRLAVRNGYLNFYRLGQSVARVSFSRDGRPFAQTHVKYVYGPGRVEQANARLRDGSIERTGCPSLPYEGQATILGWIKAINGSLAEDGGHAGWVGEEKDAVDRVLSVNPEVIDLEMGLPAHDGGRSAYRMDMVALEPSDLGPKVVFWEAKLLTDKRLGSETPKVLTQLERYRVYLSDEVRQKRVGAAYRDACGLLVRLHNAAMEAGPIPPLSDSVREAAGMEGGLTVDPKPRLAVLDFGKKSATRAHLQAVEALREKGVSVVLQPPRNCRLAYATNA